MTDRLLCEEFYKGGLMWQPPSKLVGVMYPVAIFVLSCIFTKHLKYGFKSDKSCFVFGDGGDMT